MSKTAWPADAGLPYSDRLRLTVQLANQEAQRFNHEYIGTEHLLLGLIREGKGVAANVLKNLDVDPRKIRLEVEKLMIPGPHMITMGKLLLTGRAVRVGELAVQEARDLGCSTVSTEHLLLGLMREREGVASQVLHNLGLRLETVRKEAQLLLGQGSQSREARPFNPCEHCDNDLLIVYTSPNTTNAEKDAALAEYERRWGSGAMTKIGMLRADSRDRLVEQQSQIEDGEALLTEIGLAEIEACLLNPKTQESIVQMALTEAQLGILGVAPLSEEMIRSVLLSRGEIPESLPTVASVVRAALIQAVATRVQILREGLAEFKAGRAIDLSSYLKKLEGKSRRSSLRDLQNRVSLLEERAWPENLGYSLRIQVDRVFARLLEESGELAGAARSHLGRKHNPEKTKSKDDVELELGDVLVCLLRIAGLLELDPHRGLRRALDKLEARIENHPPENPSETPP